MNQIYTEERVTSRPPSRRNESLLRFQQTLGHEVDIDFNAGIVELGSSSRRGINLKSINLEALSTGTHTLLLTFRNGTIGKLTVSIPDDSTVGEVTCHLKMAKDNRPTKIDTKYLNLSIQGNSCIASVAKITYLAQAEILTDTPNTTSNVLTDYNTQRRDGAEFRAREKGINTDATLSTTVVDYGRIHHAIDQTEVFVRDHLSKGHDVVITTRSGSQYRVGIQRKANGVYATLTPTSTNGKYREKIIDHLVQIPNVIVGSSFSYAGATTSPVVSCDVTLRNEYLTEVYNQQGQHITRDRLVSLAGKDFIVATTRSGNQYFFVGSEHGIVVTSSRNIAEGKKPSFIKRELLPEFEIGKRLLVDANQTTSLVEIRYCHRAGKITADDALLLCDGITTSIECLLT